VLGTFSLKNECVLCWSHVCTDVCWKWNRHIHVYGNGRSNIHNYLYAVI